MPPCFDTDLSMAPDYGCFFVGGLGAGIAGQKPGRSGTEQNAWGKLSDI